MSKQNIVTVDREAEIRERAEKYPEPMQLIARHFSQRRASKNGQYLVLESTCRAQELTKEYVRMALNPAEKKQYYKCPGSEENTDEGHDGEFSEHDHSWCGMGARKLAAEFRGKTQKLHGHFEKAREELARTGIKERLEESLQGLKKKRKRFFSEHDGDFDHDRRWDSTPFSSTKQARREFPYLEVAFPMNMNASASAETVAKFGARCLALAEVLEQAGFRVAITGEHWNVGLTKNSPEREAVGRSVGLNCVDGGSTHVLNRVILRDADEYGDIAGFAAYTSVEFFRRVMFSTIYNAAHYIHGIGYQSRVASNLGSSLTKRPLPPGPGVVVLDQTAVDGIFSLSKEVSEKYFKERIMHSITPEYAAQRAS